MIKYIVIGVSCIECGDYGDTFAEILGIHNTEQEARAKHTIGMQGTDYSIELHTIEMEIK